MRTLPIALIVTIMLASGVRAEDGVKIRDFDIKTIESLGRELYKRDDMASKGTDLVFAKFPESRDLIRGWVSETGPQSSTTWFLQVKDSAPSLAYTVTFPQTGEPVAKDVRGEPVPGKILVRYRARQNAIAAVRDRLTRTYNFEVLDDPVGKGFIVYGLASTQDPNEIMVGVHYRISVSEDGSKITSVDALSKSMLILQKKSPDVPKDSSVVAYSMSHIVSNTPVETHVYLSLLHGMPLYVGTPDGNVYKVENGSITKMKVDPKK